MAKLIDLTSDEIDSIDRKFPILIPVGLIEAHGPHLAVSVDIVTAEYFASEAAQQTGAILAPGIPYGFADEMKEYPGTLGIRHTTLTLLVKDIILSFCEKKFEKIIFIIGHGANKTPVEMAFHEVWETYPDFKGLVLNWWSDCGIAGIHHADKGETEVALALDVPAKMNLAKEAHVDKPWYKIRSRFTLDPSSGGVNGDPTKADIENGKKIIQQALDAMVAKINQAIKD